MYNKQQAGFLPTVYKDNFKLHALDYSQVVLVWRYIRWE